MHVTGNAACAKAGRTGTGGTIMLSSVGRLFISSLVSACPCPGKRCWQMQLCQGVLPERGHVPGLRVSFPGSSFRERSWEKEVAGSPPPPPA